MIKDIPKSLLTTTSNKTKMAGAIHQKQAKKTGKIGTQKSEKKTKSYSFIIVMSEENNVSSYFDILPILIRSLPLKKHNSFPNSVIVMV